MTSTGYSGREARPPPRPPRTLPHRPSTYGHREAPEPRALVDWAHESGMHAVTVISTSSSGEFSMTSTVVRAGLFVGKYLPYSSL